MNAALRPPGLAVAAGSEAWQDPGAARAGQRPHHAGAGSGDQCAAGGVRGIARRFCRRAGKSGGNGQCSAPAGSNPVTHATCDTGPLTRPTRNARHSAANATPSDARQSIFPSSREILRSSSRVRSRSSFRSASAFSTRFATASVLSTRRSSVRCIANLSLCSSHSADPSCAVAIGIRIAAQAPSSVSPCLSLDRVMNRVCAYSSRVPFESPRFRGGDSQACRSGQPMMGASSGSPVVSC